MLAFDCWVVNIWFGLVIGGLYLTTCWINWCCSWIDGVVSISVYLLSVKFTIVAFG